MNNILDIKHAFYINLASRPDRKQHVEEQLQILGINAQRFNAIKLPNGALGCSMSHLKCLEIAKQNNLKYVNPDEARKLSLPSHENSDSWSKWTTWLWSSFCVI